MRYDARARVTLSILGTIAYVILLSIGFVGGGQVLKSLFDIPLFPAMLIMAVPFITYTALGGLWASAVTNIIKFCILCVGLVILVSFAISKAGGWSHLTIALPPGSFNLFSAGAWPFVWAFFWVMTLSMWVAADIYQLVFSAKNARAAKVGLSFAGVIIALVGLAAAFIGIFPKIDPEAAMPTLAATLAPGLRGLVAIAMLSGSAIAVVIFQIVAATQLVRGIWPQKQMAMNKVRWISAMMGVLGLLFAWLDPNVVSLTELTFRIFIPATFVPTLAAFYWRRATAVGALFCSLAGVAASVLWHFLVLPKLTQPLDSWFEPAFIGVAVSFVVLAVTSFLSKPSPAEKWRQFMPQRSR